MILEFFDVMHSTTVMYGPGPYRTWLDGLASVHIVKPEHIEVTMFCHKLDDTYASKYLLISLSIVLFFAILYIEIIIIDLYG